MGLTFLNIRTYYKLTGIETCGIGIEVDKQTKGMEPKIKPTDIWVLLMCSRWHCHDRVLDVLPPNMTPWHIE